ncbi:MAG: LruC domain-containing protein [Leptospiraceae bacterium]
MRINSQVLALAIVAAGSLILTDCKKDKDALPFFLLGADAQSTPGTTTTGETSEGTTVTTTNGDVTGEEDFEFQNSETIDVNITVVDDDGEVDGAVVTIKDGDTGEVLYQGVTGEDGVASGTIEVTPDNETLNLVIEVGDEVIEDTIATEDVQEVNREVTIDGSANTDTGVADADNDGISDENDAYPNDPDRATIVKLPSADGLVVAYEDLYPSPGDADFNDYVVKVYHEIDLNSAGKVVRLRGVYQHLARGAGYKHTLHLNLPGSGDVNHKLYDYQGRVEEEIDEYRASLNDIEVMPESNKTLGHKNTANGQSYKEGKYSELEITFSEPMTRSELGRAPFDLFIKVINTGHEVHFAGKYFEDDGSDRYLDSNGFPWALSVPKQWNWPYEKSSISEAYPDFDTWYLSLGQEKADWYKRANEAHTFPYVTEGALAAYIRAGFQNGSILWTLLALGIAGLAALFFYREKSHRANN